MAGQRHRLGQHEAAVELVAHVGDLPGGGVRVVGRLRRAVAADHHHRLGDAVGPVEHERSAGGDGEVADGRDATGVGGRGADRRGGLRPDPGEDLVRGDGESGATAPSTR